MRGVIMLTGAPDFVKQRRAASITLTDRSRVSGFHADRRIAAACYNPKSICAMFAFRSQRTTSDHRPNRSSSARRYPGGRSDPRHDRPVLHDDARRSGRGCHQGRDARQRGRYPRTGVRHFLEGEAVYYLSVNRNKRSIALDLKSEAGKEALWRLIDGADVVIENFSPGTIGRLGFGWEAIHARNPRAVMASISGFGQTGPGSQRTAYDLVVQGMGGIMSVTGPVGGPPTKYGVPIGDMGAGMFAAYAIAAALFRRSITGEGQYIDVSMLGGQIALLVYNIGSYFATGNVPQPAGNAHSIIVPYDAFPTADGYVNIAVGNDVLFARFCQAIGIAEIGSDPRFANNALRVENRAGALRRDQRRAGPLTTDDVIARLDKVAVPCGPILTSRSRFRERAGAASPGRNRSSSIRPPEKSRSPGSRINSRTRNWPSNKSRPRSGSTPARSWPKPATPTPKSTN